MKLIYPSTHSNQYLWDLILRGEQKEKSKTLTNANFSPISVVGTKNSRKWSEDT